VQAFNLVSLQFKRFKQASGKIFLFSDFPGNDWLLPLVSNWLEFSGSERAKEMLKNKGLQKNKNPLRADKGLKIKKEKIICQKEFHQFLLAADLERLAEGAVAVIPAVLV